MVTSVKHTGHLMLINNFKNTPMIYLIQEKNKTWGIFGGGQEPCDKNSITNTVVRELHEETVGSLNAYAPMFRFADTYGLHDHHGGMHKTFIAINSKISAKHIKLDQPGAKNAIHSDILRGMYVPLYLVLSNIYKKQYKIFYNGETLNLRYFFAEAIRRNKNYLYTVFNKKYIIHTEMRNEELGLHAVSSNVKLRNKKHIEKPRLVKPFSNNPKIAYIGSRDHT